MNNMSIESVRKEMVKFVNGMEVEHRDLILSMVETLPITISSRMKRTLGQVTYSRRNMTPIKFTFNKKYLDYGNMEDVIDTIHHEVIHILANTIYQANMGHSEYWKSLCRRYGVRPDRCKSTNYYSVACNSTAPAKVTTNYKYHIVCSECGKIVARRNRLDKRLIKGYKSSCHRAPLEVIDVNTGKKITI